MKQNDKKMKQVCNCFFFTTRFFRPFKKTTHLLFTITCFRALCSYLGLRHSRRDFSTITEVQTNGQTIENHNHGVTDKRTDY